MRILVVEDVKKVASFLEKGLREEGYAVDVAHDGVDGGMKARVYDYDLLLVDVMLPEETGFELVRELRQSGSAVPVLMLTAMDSEQDVVMGLDAGADDYLTKPFGFDELLARVRALLRRGGGSRGELLIYKDLRLRVEPWEEGLREQSGSRLVSPRQVRDSPGDYILCFSFWDAKNLIDINVQGGLYVYSSSEAYTEEQEMDFERLRNWLGHFGIRSVGLPYEQRQSISALPEEGQGLHSSGHANANDIMDFVREIGPQTVVPIHTENPGYFLEHLRNTDVEVAIREYGGTLTFG